MKLSFHQTLKRSELVQGKFWNIILPGRQILGEEGRETSLVFVWKSSKIPWICPCLGYIFHLRVSTKKLPTFLTAGPFSVFLTEYLLKCPCPMRTAQKFLVTRLFVGACLWAPAQLFWFEYFRKTSVVEAKF